MKKLNLLIVTLFLMFSMTSNAQIVSLQMTKGEGEAITIACKKNKATQFSIEVAKEIRLDVEINDFEITFKSQAVLFNVFGSKTVKVDDITATDNCLINFKLPESKSYFFLDLTLKQDYWVVLVLTPTEQKKLKL